MDMVESLDENLNRLMDFLGVSSDVKVRRFRFGPKADMDGALVFIDGLVDSGFITDAILKPVVGWQSRGENPHKGRALLDALQEEALYAGDIEPAPSIYALSQGCLSGDTALLVDGCDSGLIISTKGWDKRSVSEPQSEAVVRGPRKVLPRTCAPTRPS
jgi:spore germination protein KA